MAIREELIKAGFTEEQAERLSKDEFFLRQHKNKDAAQLVSIVSRISGIYSFDASETRELISKFPPFIGYDHSRAIREATEVYGDEKNVKKAILKFPPFAGLDHSRAVREATEVYKNEEKVKEAILKYPHFAGLNHQRVIKEATEVYGDEKKVKEAILKYPPFAGLNHSRVMRNLTRLGRIAGIKKQDVIERILQNPVLAGCSYRRYLAGLDVGRQLSKEGFEKDDKMLESFFTLFVQSPYVPETDKLRISKAGPGHKEPPLLIRMRKKLQKEKKS